MGKVPKICKCGHFKTNHGKFGFSNCQDCACTEYLNHKKPGKVDFGFMVYGFIMIGFMIFAGLNIIDISSNIINEQITIKISDIVVMSSLFFFGLAPLLLLQNAILPYFNDKKRKDYSIKA